MIYFLLRSPKWVAQLANPMRHRRLYKELLHISRQGLELRPRLAVRSRSEIPLSERRGAYRLDIWWTIGCQL
jgi:hypothetical protein